MIDYYKTQDNRAVYEFDFVERPDGWRCYIRNQPAYSRPAEQSVAHWLQDVHGRYICFTGRLGTLTEARVLAAAWADRTQVFIQTGRFPQ